MSRPPTKTSVTSHLDDECSRITRSLGYCERCLGKDNLQAAHVFGRKLKAVRWDFRNILCLCASCHAYFHDRPTMLKEFYIEKRGEEAYNEIKESAHKGRKWILDDMLDLLKSLKHYERPKPNPFREVEG